MPQVKKRTTKDKSSDEVYKKGRKENLATSTNFTKRKCKITNSSEVKPLNPNFKSSEVKLDAISQSIGEVAKNSQIPKLTNKRNTKEQKGVYLRKESECGKAKDGFHSLKLKGKPEDKQYCFNLSDSGIQSDAVDFIQDENKPDIYIKAETSGMSSKNADTNCNGEATSSESEWEEVEEHCENCLKDYKPDIPREGVEITIDCPDLQIRKRKKQQFDANECIRMLINKVRKDVQLSMHKTHLLCLLAHGMYVNKILNSDILKALAISVIPSDILSLTSGRKIDKVDICRIEKIVTWFHDAFTFETDKSLFLNLFLSMVNNFGCHKSLNASEYNLMFIVIARTLGFKVRFCVSLYPISFKATNLIKKSNSNKRSKKEAVEQTGNKRESFCVEIPEKGKVIKKTKTVKGEKEYSNVVSHRELPKISRPRRFKRKSYKLSSDEEDDNVDEDFIMENNEGSDEYDTKHRRVHSKQKCTSLKRKSNHKVLSSDSKPSPPNPAAVDPGSIVCWAEVFLKSDKQWVSVECAHKIINKPYNIEVFVPQPVSYILAFDNESFVKDVTRRYCKNYMTDAIKLRVGSDWWENTLASFLPPDSKQNKEEEKKLDEMLVNKPLPHTIKALKNHPLYGLKRHLLKFEGIYPPDAPPVGFIRSEPIYARDCIHQLRSRETWFKEARVVRIGEEPYKIVRDKPTWDRIARVCRTGLPLEIFGMWQTEPYEPPIAVDGKVPRNEYGNVELFKPSMLPRGTVHLRLPGLNRVAKKLGIDCSPAVVGSDSNKGSVHPVMLSHGTVQCVEEKLQWKDNYVPWKRFDGFVVCEEFKDTLIAAWEEEQENARKRVKEKKEKNIYSNWRKLIKGLLIRERIKRKYNTG